MTVQLNETIMTAMWFGGCIGFVAGVIATGGIFCAARASMARLRARLKSRNA